MPGARRRAPPASTVSSGTPSARCSATQPGTASHALGSSATRSPPPRWYRVSPSSSRSRPGQRPRLSRASRRSAGSRPMTRTPAALAPEAAEPMRARSSTVTARVGSARRRWKAALKPMRPPPTITTDMNGSLTRIARVAETIASPEARDHVLREEPHRAEHALVGNLPAHVHPHGQRGVAEGLTELEQALGDRVGRAVDDQLLEDLVVGHAAEPGGLLAPRAPAECLGDGAEEVHRARTSFLARLPPVFRQVDGDDQRHLAAPGMAGLPPRLVIAADEALEVADRRGAHCDEDRHAHPPHDGVRLLRGGGDAQRRVRLLEGLGRHAHVAVLEILSLVREPLLRPRLDEDLERLVESLPAFGMRDIEALVVLGQPAPAHAEVQPSLAQVIDGGHVLRQVKRVGQREDLKGDADSHPSGAGGDGRGDDEGRGWASPFRSSRWPTRFTWRRTWP